MADYYDPRNYYDHDVDYRPAQAVGDYAPDDIFRPAPANSRTFHGVAASYVEQETGEMPSETVARWSALAARDSDPLVGLLQDWVAEIEADPFPALVSLDDAYDAVQTARKRYRATRRG